MGAVPGCALLGRACCRELLTGGGATQAVLVSSRPASAVATHSVGDTFSASSVTTERMGDYGGKAYR